MRSVVHVDALLLLRQNPRRWCSGEAVAASLGISPDRAGRVLEQLGAENLVDVKIAASVLYRFAPLDTDVDPIVAEIASVHQQRREAIESAAGRRRRRTRAMRPPDKRFRMAGGGHA